MVSPILLQAWDHAGTACVFVLPHLCRGFMTSIAGHPCWDGQHVTFMWLRARALRWPHTPGTVPSSF